MPERKMYQLLLVDDEEIILRGLRQTIDWTRLGYSIVGTAMTGNEALEFVEQTPPDVILTDISMPGMNGIELLKAVRKRHPSVRLVLLSGYDEFRWAREGMRHGAEDYILKNSLEDDIEQVFCKLRTSLDAERFGQRQARDLQLRYENLATEKLVVAAVRGELDSDRVAWSAESEPAHKLQQETGCIICMLAEFDQDPGPGYPENVSAAERVLAVVKTYDVDHAFPVSPNEVVVFVSCRAMDVADCRSQVRHVARRIVADLLGREPDGAGMSEAVLNLAVGIGEAGRGWEALRSSYLQASQAANRQTEGERASVREWRNLDTRVQKTPILTEQNRVVESVLNGDDATAVNAVRVLFARMKCEDGTIDVAEAISTVIELVSVLYHTMRESGLPVEREYGSAAGVYARLHRVRTLQTLIHLTESAIAAIAHIVRRKQSIRGSARIQSVVSFIHHNVAQRHTQHDLAKMAGISPAHFSVLFKKYTGKSLTEYLIDQRMEKARELLAAGKGVAETAQLLGYENVPHFSNMFKRHYGVSPAFSTTGHKHQT